MTDILANCSFDSKVQRTPRVLEVAEAFGLGLSDKRFVIYDNLKLTINQGDIVYINGQSGSGKSILLRDIQRQLVADGKRVTSIDSVIFDDELPLVDQIGTDTNHALKLLSQVGLNDAYLFIRRPSELSDGQRYRFKLAKLIQSDAEVWVADEFGAVLDRTTAKVVAHSIQHAARAAGVTVIAATTHTDLIEELAPTLVVRKRFREKVDVQQAAV